MKFIDLIKIAFEALRRNKARSLLTVLGIVIGITAIILVVSIGRGAEQLILNQVQAFGSKTISVEPGRQPQGPSDFAELFSDSLKQEDVEALKKSENVQGVEKVTPIVMQSETVSYEGETFRSSIMGSTNVVAEVLDVYPEQGFLFTDEDVESRESVAVIGNRVKEELFGPSDAVGEKIKIKGRPFRVVGVLGEKGQGAFFNTDEMILIPYTTAQSYLFGIDHFHSIMVQAETEDAVPRVEEEITLTLRELHDIDDPSKDDFRVETQEDAKERVGTITGILTALLVSVAAISLVVGGVGIMNIMLVSVVERTKEIGLRKAVGATRKDIMNQFLLESVILTGVGGILGVFIGFLISWGTAIALSQFFLGGWELVFSIPAALIGFGVSALIGLTFGLYPARQAADKSPIEALRYE